MLSSFLYPPPATSPLSPWFLHLSILITSNNICCDGCSEMSESASPYTAARNFCILATSYQWRSQNRKVARAQVGHIYNAAQHAKVSVRKHALLGESGGMPLPPPPPPPPRPRKILEFRTSKIASAGSSGRVSVAKTRIPMQYSGSALVAIQLSRKLFLVR